MTSFKTLNLSLSLQKEKNRNRVKVGIIRSHFRLFEIIIKKEKQNK